MNPIADQIEQYLLAQRAWIPVHEIAEIFHVRERALRYTYEVPGLCSAFAISSDRGLKHVALATTEEWMQFKHRMRRHAIGEMVRTRVLDRTRNNVTKTYRARQFERDTGQALLAV
jgi:hypothetical protein